MDKGQRSETVIGYSLNGATVQANNSFPITVSESNKQFTIKANYNEGEQTKDSEGNNFGTVLSAGSAQTTTIYSFVETICANTSSINTLSK